ncbi:MAG: MurR/RpiR family transcriptional regulator [Anaerolineae bacterium]|jgi:DNA-binding MurR/RpiR family transcriptional regulator|nr:MurR/RpiR family transcriptional regulator [Anaerolineae bacterium]
MELSAPSPNLLLTIRGLLPSLNEQEQKVGQYVLDHPNVVIHLAMVELAERCGVGDTTIFRFCRRVKTDGYQDFKIALAQELSPRISPVYEAVAAGDTAATAAQKAIAGDVKALEDTLRVLDLEALDRAATALLAARRVDIYGSGGAAVAAQELQYKLMRIGVRALPHTDAQMQLLSAAMLTPNDVAVGFSHSGTAADVRQALVKAKECGAVTIAITNHPLSPIARLVDISLRTAAQEAAAHGYPLGARVAQIGLIDVLYTCLMLKHTAA